MRTMGKTFLAVAAAVAWTAAAVADEVATSIKDVELEIVKGKEAMKVPQKRWLLENAQVRLGVTDDPGGAVVEFTNKATGVNHVAGDVYKTMKDGAVKKATGWGWIDYFYDNATDPMEKWIFWQPYKIEFLDGEGGAKSIKATGRTAEQVVERVMTLKPGSAELVVNIKITNASGKERPMWIRWHPRILPSKDDAGRTSCALSPGEGDQVRKIRGGWGWDHWLRTVDGYWLAADFKSGDGLFCTYEKDKVAYCMTWTEYSGVKNRGAISMEPFPQLKIIPADGSIQATFSYLPFTRDTKPDEMPLGVLQDKTERERARTFLRRAASLEHLEKFGGYTLAQSEYFDWQHRRRDLFGLRDWGFADCAIMGYPIQEKPLKVRMIGGVFAGADKLNGFPTWNQGVDYLITARNQDGLELYRNLFHCGFAPGVPGLETYDRELSVPMADMPDGSYSLSVEALDPITKKPFHSHRRELKIFGRRLADAAARFAAESAVQTQDRPFVTALVKQAAVEVKDGRAVIPVGVEDGSGQERRSFPVTLGVPLPQGAFKADAPVRLLAPDGAAVPAQFRVMSVWPDKSLKWLQADFQADCGADKFVFYHLEVGKGVSPAKAGADLLQDDGKTLMIDTGVMRLMIDKAAPSIACRVVVGGVEVTDKSLFGETWWEDPDKGMALMRLDGAPSGIFKPGVSVEENGPLTATVKLQGWYVNQKTGKAPAYGELRLRLFKGKAWLRAWHQVTFTGSPWDDRLASYGIKLQVKPGLYETAQFDIDGKCVDVGGDAVLHQSASDRLSLAAAGKTVAEGGRSDGAARLQGKDGSFLFEHLNLWQMFPKKIAANAAKGELVVSYWPKEAGVHSFAPNDEYWIPSSSSSEACGTGAGRTQELALDFSAAVAVTQARAVYAEPVVACVPPDWVGRTKVVGNLSPYDPSVAPKAEEFMKLYVDFHLRNRELFKLYGHWDYGTLHNVYNVNMYQWLIVGRYANIGNEEDIVQAPWLLYFRSGDRKYLEFAQLWTRHLMEVQSIRWHDLFPEGVGMSRRHHHTPWLGGADYGHTMLCPYLEYYHATGYRPAWEMAEMTAAAMDHTYDGSWRYIINPLVGSIRMYLETGDAKYKRTADRIWNDLMRPDRNDWWGGTHGSRLARWYAPFNPECMDAWKKWVKAGLTSGTACYQAPFREIDSLGDLGDMTDDPWFAHMTRLSFNRWMSESTGLNHGTNPVYRGMIPNMMNTQYYMGLCRQLATGKGQIAKSKQLFPAGFYHLGQVNAVAIRKERDDDFKIWISGADAKAFGVTRPDGKPADTEVKEVFDSLAGAKSTRFFEINVKKDGQTGAYTMRPFALDYFGCSLKKTVVLVGNRLKGSGDSLYVRSDDLGAPKITVVMEGSPGASLELFSLDGKTLFSKTMVRPANDAVGVTDKAAIPAGAVLRLGDRTGAMFLGVKEIPLFLNPDGIFDYKAK